MEFVKNSIEYQDLSTPKEVLHQISEAKYHLKNIRLSLKESLYHLKKYSHHASLANKTFNSEDNHA